MVAAAAVVLSGCQPSDQTLPFDLAEGEAATSTIGSSGGTVSVPPSFSIEFPAGALSGSTTVDVAPRISAPFPDAAGAPVSGTAYDVGPAGQALAQPATVEIEVPTELLEVGEEVLLSVAVLQLDGTVKTYQSEYDLTNGVLTAEIDELGPVAAVVSQDAIEVALGSPPSLDGGTIPQPVAPSPSGPALSSYGGTEFTASCSPDARQCFSSGLIKVWADEVVQERMGDQLYLLDASVDVVFEFIDFDPLSGLPTSAAGYVRVDGDLRARFNSLVTGYELTEGKSTGPTGDPVPTGVTISGSIMTLDQTTTADGVTTDFQEELEFSVDGIGTSEMLTIRVEVDVFFDNDDGTQDQGLVTVDVRLRR